MKFLILLLFLLMAFGAHAEKPCDLRPGTSLGIKVIEFVSGNTIHSKIPFKETTADALLEEMISLQDEGVCAEKMVAQKCALKFEKLSSKNYVSLIRGDARWSTWHLASKTKAEAFIKNLKRVGFCS